MERLNFNVVQQFWTIAFSSVLWGISQPLVFFLVLYALTGTLVTTVVFGKPLVRLNFEPGENVGSRVKSTFRSSGYLGSDDVEFLF